MIKTKQCELIELNIGSSTSVTKHKFDEIARLRNKKVIAIDVYEVGDVPKSPLDKSLVNADAFKDSYLILAVDGAEAVNAIPLISLSPQSNNGLRMEFDSIEVDWINSYVELANSDDLVADESYLFLVYYED